MHLSFRVVPNMLGRVTSAQVAPHLFFCASADHDHTRHVLLIPMQAAVRTLRANLDDVLILTVGHIPSQTARLARFSVVYADTALGFIALIERNEDLFVDQDQLVQRAPTGFTFFIHRCILQLGAS